MLLALYDERPVGLVAWSGHMLDALYILPQHAGRGIGTHLLAVVPARVDALWVLVDNGRGRKFYEQHGWLDTGVVRAAYEPANEVLYRR